MTWSGFFLELRCQCMIFGIRWHDFVRNSEVIAATNLPSVQNIITKRWNSVFGHVVRLDNHTPAHRALSEVAVVRIGSCLNSGWRRRPGLPRCSWIQHNWWRYPFRHPHWMVQCLLSCTFQVDATDLRCLRDPTTMMTLKTPDKTYSVTGYRSAPPNYHNPNLKPNGFFVAHVPPFHRIL